MDLHNDISEIYFTKEQIAEGVQKLAQTLTNDYKDKNPILVCILKGSLVFFADLIRNMDFPLVVDCVKASSYGDLTVSTGKINVKLGLSENIEGRDVILVEDIIDSGLTLNCLRDLLLKNNPNSIKIVTLLNKPARRKIDIAPDYKVFDVDDKFIVGYGLDFAEKYRNLNYIGVLKEELYK